MYPENPNNQQPQKAAIYYQNGYNQYPVQQERYNQNNNYEDRNQHHEMHKIYIISDSQYPRLANGYSEPVMIKCPRCDRVGTTIIRHSAGGGTWVCCLILAFTVGCCCLPFLIKSCQNADHFCSNCGTSVGHYEYTIL